MKIKILTILRLRPQGVDETALRIEMEMRFRIKVGDLEFETALHDLESGKHITQETDDITGDRIWKTNE